MKEQEKYKVIVTLVAGLLVIKYIFELEALVYVSFAIILASAVSSWMAEKIAWAWMKFAEVIGYVMQRVILSAIFYILLSPIAFFYRIFNEDPLQLKKMEDSDSYYETRNHDYTPRDLAKPW